VNGASPADRPEVSVLLISWNSSDVLGSMLATLAAATEGRDVELVHVDNASADRSVGLVAGAWPGRLVQEVNDTNLGFATALRQAVELATGATLLILNPDARLEPEALGTMLDRLDRDPGLGAVGPLVRESTGEPALSCARRAPGLRLTLFEALGVQPLMRGTWADVYTFAVRSYAHERDVPCLSGAAMLIRASALAAAGGVDDRFFMYFEDIDICERLRRAGYRLRFCPAAAVTHLGASSSPRDPDLQTWLDTQLVAAVNRFLAVHRGRVVALSHRALVVFGALRVLATRRLRYPTGAPLEGAPIAGARLRWALRGELPAGDPALGGGQDPSQNRHSGAARG
jgi:GT2 family glycosyltransferase